MFRCPRHGRFLRPGFGYSFNATELRYAHCPACEAVFAFAVDGPSARAVASFAEGVDGISPKGVCLGTAGELSLAERGVRMIAWASAQHPADPSATVTTSPPPRQRRRRGRRTAAEP